MATDDINLKQYNVHEINNSNEEIKRSNSKYLVDHMY